MARILGLPLLVLLVISAIALPVAYFAYDAWSTHEDPVYFGVSYGGDSVEGAKLLVDKVKDYSNFFIVNSYDISDNESALSQICDYVAEADLDFVVYFFSVYNSTWKLDWIDEASSRWEGKFLGVYLRDEHGGRQIDLKETVPNATDSYQAAEIFVNNITKSYSVHTLQDQEVPLFISDYALYRFDYVIGYDTVFVELGWNNSRAQQIALCRGAANSLGRDWGAIITWTYMQPPYIDGAPQILQDMHTAYDTGAKYIVVFNYPTNPTGNPYGILQEEHFEAMEQFWDYLQTANRNGAEKAEAVLVLPKDYGGGLRRLDDLVWGLWEAKDDATSLQVWENLNKLSATYNFKLDAVYENDKNTTDLTKEYAHVYLWNQTIA